MTWIIIALIFAAAAAAGFRIQALTRDEPPEPPLNHRWRAMGGGQAAPNLRRRGGVGPEAGRLGVDRARWGASGALYPQSAPAGLNPLPRSGVADPARARRR